MARSTSSVPQQANGEAGAGAPKAPMGAVLDQARQFVESERERATARKQVMVKTERAHVLADLKSWQSQFKVPLPIPKDILPILSKDEAKQKQIETKADKALLEIEEHKKLAKSPKPAAAVPSTPETPKQSPGGVKKIPMKIPEIPPFRKRVPPAVPVPETAAQNISIMTSPTPSHSSITSGGAAAKLNPNASAFVFKPNPSAAAFKPADAAAAVVSPASGAAKLPAIPAHAAPPPPPAAAAAPPVAAAPVPAPVASPAAGAAAPPPAAAASTSASASTKQQNPFYKDGPPKRIVVDPRSDFNPFKNAAGHQVPQANTVPAAWPYTGRRSSIAAFNTPLHPMAMQPGGGGFDGEDPSSPHQGPPPMLQGLPPNMLPFYRYQPGMPPQVQGGMMAAPMFSPGPNVFPQQMGSPHLGQQPPQGPNGSEF